MNQRFMNCKIRDFEQVLTSQSTIEWLSANFYTPRIRNGEIRMEKYLDVVITIMNDVLWRGREGAFALSRMLIQFSDSKQPSNKFTNFIKIPQPKFYFLMGPNATPVGIKTRGQDDIIFIKCTQIFHLFDKISGNSGSHFLQPSYPLISNLK